MIDDDDDYVDFDTDNDDPKTQTSSDVFVVGSKNDDAMRCGVFNPMHKRYDFCVANRIKARIFLSLHANRHACGTVSVAF